MNETNVPAQNDSLLSLRSNGILSLKYSTILDLSSRFKPIDLLNNSIAKIDFRKNETIRNRSSDLKLCLNQNPMTSNCQLSEILQRLLLKIKIDVNDMECENLEK